MGSWSHFMGFVESSYEVINSLYGRPLIATPVWRRLKLAGTERLDTRARAI